MLHINIKFLERPIFVSERDPPKIRAPIFTFWLFPSLGLPKHLRFAANILSFVGKISPFKYRSPFYIGLDFSNIFKSGTRGPISCDFEWSYDSHSDVITDAGPFYSSHTLSIFRLPVNINTPVSQHYSLLNGRGTELSMPRRIQRPAEEKSCNRVNLRK